MNLELARVAAINRGVIIVDSTRLGKRYPDSMTATVSAKCANPIMYTSELGLLLKLIVGKKISS